jgi:transglutaminase-like putative cysteine protease
MFWITVALTLVCAPQTVHFPVWISLVIAGLAGWRLLIAQRAWPLPHKALRRVLALAALAGVYGQFGTVLGRDAGVALLAIMVALKLLETRSQRDAIVLIFMGYFLVATNFLYEQSIFIALFMFVAVWVLTGTLVYVNRLADTSSVRPTLRLGAVLLVQSLPFMLLLFVLFPRVSGALWDLPGDNHSASTGLSDQMSPGNIGSLAQSQEVAFRVTFSATLPATHERYWRGPVFWFTDGRSWSAGRVATSPAQQIQVFGEPLDYRVTLEPHQKNWLFALDLPATAPDIGQITGDFQLLSRQPVRERVHYALRSYTRYQTGALTLDDLTRALALPEGINPRTHQLAESWRAQFEDDAQLVQHALNYFRNEAFFYTLTPPLLGKQPRDNTVDQFLFSTRRGFCEHYAAAFVTLMRAAGIPARVVTGYQGGELNPLGNYLIVRQADAHAWAEVWLQNRGWVRTDPTAAIAPTRIEQGRAALDQLAGADGFFTVRQDLWGRAWLQLQLGWDAVNYQWVQWVVGYGQDRQNQLLSQLGLDKLLRNAADLGVALAVGVGLLSCGFTAWFLLRARRVHKDVVATSYRRFCAQLARRGIVRIASEGPQDFARRAAGLRPNLAAQIEHISQLYIRLRYAAHPTARALIDLRNQVRGFHP